MAAAKLKDIIYGQNWIEQGVQWRRRHHFCPFETSVHSDVVRMIGNMASREIESPHLFRMRHDLFLLRQGEGQDYVMVR